MNKNLFKFLLKENKNLIIIETIIFSIISIMLFITNLAFANNDFGYSNLSMILRMFLMFGSLLFIFLIFINFIISFSFFHGKDKVDFYHGLPIKRQDMFYSNYFATLVSSFIPYILFFILASFLSYFSMRSFSVDFPFETVIFLFIKIVLFSLFFSSLTVLFACITGKTSATIILVVAGLFSPFLLISPIYYIFSFSINQGITSQKDAMLHKVFSLFTSTNDIYSTGFENFSILNAKILILITVFLLLLANSCYTNFKSENTDNFITINGLSSFFPYLFGFLTAEIVTIFCASIMNTYVYYTSYKSDRIFLLIMFLLSYIISFCLFKSISKGKFNKNFLSIKNISPIFVITFIFFSISFFDIFGLIKKLPDVSKIDEVRFNSSYSFSEMQNKEKLKELNKYMIDTSELVENKNIMYKRTVFSYIDDEQYKTVRYYEQPLDDTGYKMLEKVFKDAEYKNDTLTELNNFKESVIKSDSTDNTCSLNSTTTNFFNSLTKEETLEIVDALYLDIQNDENFGPYTETTPSIFILSLYGYDYNGSTQLEIKPYYENVINYVLENKPNMTIVPKNLKSVTYKTAFDARSVYSSIQEEREYIDLDTKTSYDFTYGMSSKPTATESYSLSNNFDSYITSLKQNPEASNIEVHTFKDFSELLDFFNSLTIYKTADVYAANYVCKVDGNTNIYRMDFFKDDYIQEFGVIKK